MARQLAGDQAAEECGAMSKATDRIVVVPAEIAGERGQQYRILHAGGVLIERTWNPEHDSARALRELGLAGKIEMWRPGKAHPDAILDIEKAARLTIEEGERRGPRVVAWRPPPSVGDRAPAVDLGGRLPQVAGGGSKAVRGDPSNKEMQSQI